MLARDHVRSTHKTLPPQPNGSASLLVTLQKEDRHSSRQYGREDERQRRKLIASDIGHWRMVTRGSLGIVLLDGGRLRCQSGNL